MNGVLVIHEYWTQVGRVLERYAGIHKIASVLAQRFSSVFRNQTEQMRCPAIIHLVDNDNSSTQAFAGRSAQGEGAQIDGGDGAAAVLENARHPFRRPRQLLQFQQRHDLDHAAGLHHITVVAQLEEQKQHDQVVSLNRATLVCRPRAAPFSCSMARLDCRRDSAVCCAASLSCVSVSLICWAPVACACMPSFTVWNRGVRVWTWWMIWARCVLTCRISSTPRRTSSENLSMPITPAATAECISCFPLFIMKVITFLIVGLNCLINNIINAID